METELCNMCMITDSEGRVLVQERLPKSSNLWSGLTFPGGHVEPGETVVASVIREVREETGLTVSNLQNCGYIQWYNPVKKSQYFVFLFKTTTFSGELKDSIEGKVQWMTLDEMLGIADSAKNRATLQIEIETLLSAELESCGIQLIDFGVNSIGVDPEYQAKLQEKSTAAIEIELAEQKALQLEKQLQQEVAQTNIDLEKARRANLVAEEQAKVYKESEEAYELKRLELLKDMLGDSDKVYFIPEGTDITLFLGNQVDGPVPVN